MGNCYSCTEATSPCCAWLFKKKPNLPSKPDVVDLPKPIIPLEEDAVFSSSRQPVEIINVKTWNYLPKLNGPAHHTGKYHLMEGETPQLVVRRGQNFSIKLSTSRRYTPETDKISLVFTVADCKKPNFNNGTQVGVMAVEKMVESTNGWSCLITDVLDDSLTFEICTSSSAIIGEWKLELDIKSGNKTHCHPAPSNLFLLFNPWVPDDNVYIQEADRRKEYVEDDTGLIWRGTATRLRPAVWQFGHYKQDVLLCVLYVLTKVCKVIPAHRADPVRVVRALSAGINSPDDNGVLVGNWSSDYSGGTKPTDWAGSIKILQQYYKDKSPVKFGQCWVFSGVVTSACRALGIPCRPITNFSSAHDTHNSLTIDYFFDDEGEVIEKLNSDSIWNFHVWNECWMRRPDLGAEYDGWQVIDATPQEESDGEYRCGPTSLAAIKKGHINKVYDVPFVFAEVNADKLYWKYRGPNCPMKLISKKTRGVGLNISTKAVGRWMREDVTSLYKHEEGTDKERTVMKEALRRCENVFARYYLNEDFEDVKFDLKLIDDIVIGEHFSVAVDVQNKGSCPYEVKVILRADAMKYTGSVKNSIKKQEFNIKIEPQSNKELKLNVLFDEYYPKLIDQGAMNIACLASIKEREYEFFSQDDFRVRKPDIKIEHDGDFVCGKTTKCTAYFTNPIPMKLTTPRFYALPSIGETYYFRLKSPVDINGVAKCEFDVCPPSDGEMTINVMFMAKELDDVDGFINVDVKPAPGTPRTRGGSDPSEPPKPRSDLPVTEPTKPNSDTNENSGSKPPTNPQNGDATDAATE